MKPERCQATAKSGKPCSAAPRPGRPLCLWHDPEAEALRADLSRKGGTARSNANRAKKSIPEALTTPELAGYLGVVFRGVITGNIEPGVGTAAAAIARALIAVNEAAAIADMERRLDELERATPKGWSA